MYANSRGITSAQDSVHRNLDRLLQRHLASGFERPIGAATRDAYEAVMADWDGRAPLLLDAGCGVGWSTLALGRAHPQHFVIGVDQSEDRISRGKPDAQTNNVRFVRADLVDFWRLLRDAKIRLDRHYLLYPNPWPKIGHLSRRWHGHAVFPVIPQLGGLIELRTNWQIYADEFAWAMARVTGKESAPALYEALDPLTPFERKYRDSGQSLWRYQLDLRDEGGAR
ncbi:tRNA (guanosine(46)-N7)-methyltransferase TrmB [Niveibacterium umoris]|uniref:tRNA (guanine(46)-N(7))-methyltransferase n=2 Tax=Niveibacterium umoris TaxID=1193620 RepID=A0A840BDN5_9RHOO|nr:tRNA (guanine-N7-)-methyltransferase [Niveibacterium umoris]